MFGNRPYTRRPRGRFLFFLPVVIVIVAAVTGVVMLLWNNLMPDILGVKRITYLQALGLLVLSRLLFGNFGGKGGASKHGMRKNHMLREKWSRMSDEERRSFREEWRKRCGR